MHLMPARKLTLILYHAPGPLEFLDYSLTDESNGQLCPTPQRLVRIIPIFAKALFIFLYLNMSRVSTRKLEQPCSAYDP